MKPILPLLIPAGWQPVTLRSITLRLAAIQHDPDTGESILKTNK